MGLPPEIEERGLKADISHFIAATSYAKRVNSSSPGSGTLIQTGVLKSGVLKSGVLKSGVLKSGVLE